MRAARLGFPLEGNADKLEMRLVWLRFLGLPCPHWLLPSIIAEETTTQGRLHFHVRASLPLLGLVTGYRGYLEFEEPGSGQGWLDKHATP